MSSLESSLEILRRTPSSGAIAKQDSLTGTFGPGPWVVVSPHDDDIVLGMGLLIRAARTEGIEVHALIVSDGSMGYVDPGERDSIVALRRRELQDSLDLLGITAETTHWLNLPDGSLVHHEGCNRDGTGLGQQLTALLRKVGAHVAFGPTPKDLHPDHRVTSRELDMACCWAGSDIWLELGQPLPPIRRFNYAVYCGFPSPPEYQVKANTTLFETKLDALACFKSQHAIREMVARIRADGPIEYFHEAHWEPYRPQLYAPLFNQRAGAGPIGVDYHRDCEQAAQLLENWPAEAWPPLLEAIRDSQKTPIMLVAEGSSRLFPAGFANYLMQRLDPALKLESSGGKEAQSILLDSFRCLFISNSGRTSEVLAAAQSLKEPEKALALVSQSPSPLGQLIPTRLVNQHPHERVVPATLSVLCQTLHLAHAILASQAQCLPLRELREGILKVQAGALPDAVHSCLGNPRHIWCVDSYCAGLDLELSLKAMEVAGLPSTPLRGHLALHGAAEAISPGDLILVNQTEDFDLERFQNLADGTQANLLTIGASNSVWQLPDIGLFSPILQLVAGWRILGALAERVGHDPDRPKKIAKVADQAF